MKISIIRGARPGEIYVKFKADELGDYLEFAEEIALNHVNEYQHLAKDSKGRFLWATANKLADKLHAASAACRETIPLAKPKPKPKPKSDVQEQNAEVF